MYWLAFFNIVLFITAFGLFIDQHYIQKSEPSAFIGFLMFLAVLLSLAQSGYIVGNGGM